MANTGQRRHKRYEVRGVMGGLLFRTQVTILNFSVSGLSFQTTERLKLGRGYALRIPTAAEPVDVSGTVRWCRLAGTAPLPNGERASLYEVGLAFDVVLSERAHALMTYLEQNAVLSLERRVIGRFTTESYPAPIEIEARFDFEVLKLSLSGMLVRTQMEPELGACFGVELILRDDVVPVRGRVAFVQPRRKQWWGETPAELGIEFLDLENGARAALSSFIANDLEAPLEKTDPAVAMP